MQGQIELNLVNFSFGRRDLWWPPLANYHVSAILYNTHYQKAQ